VDVSGADSTPGRLASTGAVAGSPGAAGVGAALGLGAALGQFGESEDGGQQIVEIAGHTPG